MRAPSAVKPCPICGRPAEHATRPFCSKRCADIDLHRWLGGHYAVPVVEEDGAEEAGREPLSPPEPRRSPDETN